MQVIKPITFNETQLISTTALNADADWSSGTTYSTGQVVTYSGKRWESLQNTNLNKQPDTNPTWWLDLGADNKHSMFDLVIGTSTTALETLTVVIKPGEIFDSIALINLNASIVKITVRDGISGPIVYEKTAGLSGTNVQDWYQYFFYGPLLKRTQVIFNNIPPYINAHITLELEAGDGEYVSLAQIVYGGLSVIGMTQYGANAGIVDYSIKNTDEFGNVSFVKRAYSKRVSAQVIVENSQLNRVQNYLYSIRATPAVWVVSDVPTFEEALVVYGWYRDFSTDIAYPTFSMMSIEIEGLT